MNGFWLALAASFLSAFGQILLKLSMNRHGAIEFSFFGLIKLLSEPVLLIALMLYASTLLLWLHILSKFPLSVAYPMLAATYAFVPLLSIYFFNDRMSFMQLVGILVIIIGLIILGQSR